MDFKKLREAYQSSSGPSHGHAYGGTGFKRPPREDDEGWDREPQHKTADVPHAVHINGKKWKSFGSQSHAQNVAKKIAGATVHKEEVDLEEGTFKYHMDKAIAANTRGDMKKKQYHLDNARTAKFAMKTTDYAKNKELLDKHKEMSEEVEQIVEYGDREYGGAYVNGRSDDALQTAKLTRQAKAAAKKAGKTFNTSAEYRLWHKKQKPKKQGVAEEAKIVHSRTGVNGTKYHIRQDSANDYSVHREVDGKLKHIDTYGSLQRAKSVLDNEVKEAVHRIGLTVTDPNHPMVSKRKETIQKTVRVTGDDREKAINAAIAHHKRKGYKVHDHHYIGTVNEEMQIDELALKPEHRAAIKKLRPSGEHSKTMLTHDSGKQIHVTREGDKVHLVTHEIGAGTGKKATMNYSHFDEAIDKEHPIAKEYHALKQHDIKTLRNMIKGQQRIVDTSGYTSKDHAISAYLRHKHGDKHVAAAMGLKEEEMETRIWEAWGMGRRDPQKGIKVGHQVRSYDFPGMHDDHYIEGHVVGETPHSYHIRTSKVVRGGKEVPVPAHMGHVEAPKGRGMFSDAYAVHKIVAKQDSVAARPEPAQGAAKSFAAVRGKR